MQKLPFDQVKKTVLVSAESFNLLSERLKQQHNNFSKWVRDRIGEYLLTPTYFNCYEVSSERDIRALADKLLTSWDNSFNIKPKTIKNLQIKFVKTNEGFVIVSVLESDDCTDKEKEQISGQIFVEKNNIKFLKPRTYKLRQDMSKQKTD